MLKVINCTSNQHREMGTAETYKEAWENQSSCIGKWDKACNGKKVRYMQDEFPDFKWPERY